MTPIFALALSIAALVVAIIAPIAEYRYTSRLWGTHEDYKRLEEAGLSHSEIEQQVAMLWPWWRIR